MWAVWVHRALMMEEGWPEMGGDYLPEGHPEDMSIDFKYR